MKGTPTELAMVVAKSMCQVAGADMLFWFWSQDRLAELSELLTGQEQGRLIRNRLKGREGIDDTLLTLETALPVTRLWPLVWSPAW
eukprot:1690617-Rhodomonas_salina.2